MLNPSRLESSADYPTNEPVETPVITAVERLKSNINYLSDVRIVLRDRLSIILSSEQPVPDSKVLGKTDSRPSLASSLHELSSHLEFEINEIQGLIQRLEI